MKRTHGWSFRQILAFGAALALGAIVLQAADYLWVVRRQPFGLHVALIAAMFLALGVWAGIRLGRPHSPQPGNAPAQAALGISERELEVLRHLAEGRSNKQIAAELHISPNTVKTHVTRLLEKLEAGRRTEAIARARDLGLLP